MERVDGQGETFLASNFVCFFFFFSSTTFSSTWTSFFPLFLPLYPQPGNGVDLLRDGRSDTFWQSDGTQPHLINIQFQNKVRKSRVIFPLFFFFLSPFFFPLRRPRASQTLKK